MMGSKQWKHKPSHRFGTEIEIEIPEMFSTIHFTSIQFRHYFNQMNPDLKSQSSIIGLIVQWYDPIYFDGNFKSEYLLGISFWGFRILFWMN